VVITGAGSGIGRAAALSVVSQGGHVAAIDVNDAAGAELLRQTAVSGRNIVYVHADVSHEAEVAEAVERATASLGRLDALIHAAGIMAGQLEDIRAQTEEMWDHVIDTNLKGAYLVAKHVARVMVPAGTGVMILIASKAGVAVGSGSFPYGASKGGVHGLALTLERHLGPFGIRVNCVCPGDVDTPLIRGSLVEAAARGGNPEDIERTIRSLSPPEQVAELLAFLASEDGASVRGTVFTS
jgi:NAD(P)-dependent dehydrogenase (short-subunit alcohol dehydrogenase family)